MNYQSQMEKLGFEFHKENYGEKICFEGEDIGIRYFDGIIELSAKANSQEYISKITHAAEMLKKTKIPYHFKNPDFCIDLTRIRINELEKTIQRLKDLNL